jgi:hypothetical protein
VQDWPEHYSPRNVQALMLAGASEVAGYSEWQALGRQVRRGEKSIPLTAPVLADDGEGGRRIVSITTAHVFDVSQTDPDPEAPARLAARRARKGRRKGKARS